MIRLNQALEGKKIRLETSKGNIFEGIVSDYIFPEDNEPEGIAGICIMNCPQRPGQWIGFNEPDIKSIEVME